MAYAPVLLTSAVTGAGVAASSPRPPASSAGVAPRPDRRAQQAVEEIVARQPPPAGPAGRHVRLYYATQASVRPPTFFVSTNHAADIGYSYRRFLVNQLRKAYGFEGTPVRLVFRAHRQKKRGQAIRGRDNAVQKEIRSARGRGEREGSSSRGSAGRTAGRPAANR